jgi:cell division septation protein DedD
LPVSQPKPPHNLRSTPASGSPSTSKNAATAADGSIVGEKPPTSNQQPATNNQQPAISPSGTIMVQIAAVSSQDVADILLASLRKKGYSVSVRHEPQDKLLHIQIGPFATRKDAEAMQQTGLISSGSAATIDARAARISSSRVAYPAGSIAGSTWIFATPGVTAALCLRIIFSVPEMAIGTIGAPVSIAR